MESLVRVFDMGDYRLYVMPLDRWVLVDKATKDTSIVSARGKEQLRRMGMAL